MADLVGVARPYAKLWMGEGELIDRFRTAVPIEPEEDAHVVKPDELTQKQREYSRQLTDIESEQSVFQDAWPTEYAHELDLLMERRRTAGDFEGWAIVQAERKRFDESHQIGDQGGDELSDLTVLKNKYRQMLADRAVAQSQAGSLCHVVNDLTTEKAFYKKENGFGVGCDAEIQA